MDNNKERTMKRLFLIVLILTISFISYSFAETIVISKAVKGNLPLDPMDSRWNTAEGIAVPMAPQNIVKPGITESTVPSIKIGSLHNGKDIAFRIEWYDPTRNDTVNMPDRFSDASALQFPVNADEEPTFMMGQKGSPVHIIQWRASWEKDITMGYMPGLSVGNLLSNPIVTLSVEELNAEGFGTLTSQERQNSKGKGFWDYAHWKVVILKPLNSGDKSDTVLTSGKTVPLAIAIWDGEKNDRGGRKNFSEGGWIMLKIE